jgi:hypothetical protein
MQGHKQGQGQGAAAPTAYVGKCVPRVGMLCREDARAALALRECYEEPTAGYGHDREEVVSPARRQTVCIFRSLRSLQTHGPKKINNE